MRGRDHPSLLRAASTAWDLLTATIRECHRAKRIRPGDPAQQGFVFWSTIHGLAVLVVDDQLPPPVLQAHSLEQLAGYATTVVLAGLAP